MNKYLIKLAMKLILTFTNNKLPRVFVRILERLSAILRLFQHSFIVEDGSWYVKNTQKSRDKLCDIISCHQSFIKVNLFGEGLGLYNSLRYTHAISERSVRTNLIVKSFLSTFPFYTP